MLKRWGCLPKTGCVALNVTPTLRSCGSTEPSAFLVPDPLRSARSLPRLLLRSQRLPEFDLVAVGIVDPGESPVGFVLAFGIDFDAFLFHPVEKCIHVVHDVVEHELCVAGPEV